ncbi:MAG: RnfABCDGE type electron transport complex subunit D, partial [Thermodesulfobacteriota bacterium]
SSSPHLLSEENIPKIMHSVIAALLPVVVTSIYIFGFRPLLLMGVCIAASVATEYVFQKVRQKEITLADGSAIVTGLLLALTLPPEFPLWAAFLGGVVAIGLGKQIFGGLGYNIFNPALLGRAFLQAAFPVMITTWSAPVTKRTIDAVTGATPLGLSKFEGIVTPHLDLLFGNIGGSLGETSVIAILIGALYLRYKGYINWRQPMSYLLSISVFSTIFWLIDPAKNPDPLFHLLAGGAMFGAFFMVTDMVTTPVTPKGQWLFGIGGGFLVVIIRLFGGLPEGVMYSILLMNAITPLLNKYTRPKVFGEVENE